MLWCVFWVYRIAHVVRLLVRGPRLRQRIKRRLYSAERIAWVAVALLFVFSLLLLHLILGITLTALIVAIGWKFLRNYALGTYFVLSNDFRIGQYIKVLEYAGQIHSWELIHCKLEHESGELLFLPYQDLMNHPVQRTSPSEKNYHESFEFAVQKPVDLIEVKQQLVNRLIYMPWIVPGSTPKLEVLEETDIAIALGISVELIDKRHLEQVIQALKASE